MTKLTSVGVALAVATMTMLAGCSLYFGSSGNGNGSGNATGGDGSGDGSGVSSPGGGSGSSSGSGVGTGSPGFMCNMDNQCAAGCFCQGGVCTEGGFCASDKDCGASFHCDTARSSCIPNTACADAQCKPGSACDAASNACVATCACATDADAVTQGFGWCDTARNTCMTGTNPAGTCVASVTCAATAPACPDNQVATVKDGCFTGTCRAITACEAAPACVSLQHQDDCDARNADCASVFAGHNCHGTTCGTGSATDCTCDSYTFMACNTQGSPVIVPGN